jgi:hypothetical protein
MYLIKMGKQSTMTVMPKKKDEMLQTVNVLPYEN